MWKQCLFNRKAHRFYHTADFPDGLLSKLKSLNLTSLISSKTPHHSNSVFLIQTLQVEDEFWTIAALRNPDEAEAMERFLCHNGQIDFSLSISLILKHLKKMTPAPELADIKLEQSNQELPQNWLEEIHPVLTMLMSGQIVSVHDEYSMEQTAQLFERILSTMPASLCWRTGIQIGGIQQEHLALTRSQDTKYGTTIKLPWTAESSYSNVVQARRHPKESSRYLGQHYTEFLREELADCKHSLVVKKHINHHFGPYARIRSSDANTFPTASSGLTYTLLELPLLKALKQSFILKTQHPKLTGFDQLKKEALKTALRAPLDNSLNFIHLTLERWPEAWLKVQHYPLAQLLCADLEPTQKMLQWITKETLPSELIPTACQSLEAKLYRAMPSAILIWKALFSLNNIPWLKSWIKQNHNLVFDYAFKSSLSGHPELLNLVRKHPLLPIVQQMEEGRPINTDLLKSWFKNSDSAHKNQVLSTFTAQMLEQYPVDAVQTMETCSLDSQLTQLLLSDKIFSWELGPQTATALLALETHEIKHLSGRILLCFANQLLKEDKDLLFQKLSLSLRTFYGALFLEKMTLGAGLLDQVSNELFQQKYRSDPDFSNSVLPFLKRKLNKEAGQNFIEYFLKLLETETIQPQCAVSKALLAIRQSGPLPELSRQDVKVLKWILRLNELKPEQKQILNLATLDIFADYYDEDFQVTEELLLELFACSEDDEAQWKRTMHRHGWEKLNGWRIFNRLNGDEHGFIGPISHIEEEACKRLPNSKLLVLLCSGVVLSDQLLNRLAEDKITFHLFKNATSLQFETAYSIAMESSAQTLQLAICSFICKKIPKEDLQEFVQPKETSFWEDLSSKLNSYWFKEETKINPWLLKLQELLNKVSHDKRKRFLHNLEL